MQPSSFRLGATSESSAFFTWASLPDLAFMRATTVSKVFIPHYCAWIGYARWRINLLAGDMRGPSGKFKTHYLVNTNSGDDDLDPAAGVAAHPQMLTAVKRSCLGAFYRQINAHRHVAEGNGIIVEISVLWGLPPRRVVHNVH